jgi:hypothetical protein
MSITTTFWQRCIDYPPCLVRLLARHPYGKPLTTIEIQALSYPNYIGRAMSEALSAPMIEALSSELGWGGIAVMNAAQFMRGCSVDFCNPDHMRRVDDYLRKKPTFRYLRASPQWEDYYKPLMKRWIDTADTQRVSPHIKQLVDRLRGGNK